MVAGKCDMLPVSAEGTLVFVADSRPHLGHGALCPLSVAIALGWYEVVVISRITCRAACKQLAGLEAKC